MSDSAHRENEGGAGAAPPPSFGLEAAQLVSYLVLIAVSAALFLAANDLPSSRWEPLGAGTFPKLVLGALGVLAALAAAVSAVKIARARRWREDEGGLARWLAEHRLVFALFVVLGLYLAAIRPVGFPLATFAFLVVGQGLLAPRTPRNWITLTVIALVFSFGLNWVFAEFFNVFLPRPRLG